jgi:hypothetical protein
MLAATSGAVVAIISLAPIVLALLSVLAVMLSDTLKHKAAQPEFQPQELVAPSD